MANARPIVTFTFDDCPLSAVTTGAQLLAAQGARGTFYLSGGLAGRIWENGPQYTPADVSRLIAEGHEIGCHTFSHLNCAMASAADIRLEISANRGFLALAAPGCRPDSFAYPYGSVGFAAKRTIQGEFNSCRGVQHGINSGSADLGLLKAMAIPHGGESGDWITPHLSRLQAENGWLILYSHDVTGNPTPYGCTPRTLAETIAVVKAAGIDVLTMAEATRQVRGDTSVAA